MGGDFDSLTANGGDTIYGGGGRDLLTSRVNNGLGANHLYGGEGDDSYVLSKAAVSILSDTDGNNDITVNDITFSNLGWEMNSAGALMLFDEAGGHRLFATLETPEGFSTLFLSGGNVNVADILDGGIVTPVFTTPGIDIVDASLFSSGVTAFFDNGDDQFIGSVFNDNVTGGDGNDLLVAPTFFGASFSRVLNGGLGFDTYSLSDIGTTTIIDPDSANSINVRTFVSQGVNFSIVGADLQVTGQGAALPFLIVKDVALLDETTLNFFKSDSATQEVLISDILAGMPHFYTFSNSADIIDMFMSTSAIYSADVFSNNPDIPLLLGARLLEGDDRFIGTVFGDTVHGGLGADTVFGGDGDDTIFGDNGNDILSGDLGKDILNGGIGNDILNGSDDDDILNGDEGNDALNGGDGNDTLIGGLGTDQLFGGAGDDTYIFAPGDDFDTIIDTEGNNTLKIVGNLALSDLRFVRVGDDLVIDIGSGVTISGYFAANNPSVIQSLVFAETNETFAIASIPLTPNLSPVAVADTFTMTRDNVLFGNVLADNGAGADFDPEGNPLSVQGGVFIGSASDQIHMDTNGQFIYAPIAGFIGRESFQYTVSDDRGGQSTGIVTVDVKAVAEDTLGTSCGNNLVGNNLSNAMYGLGGDDILHGKKGDDSLYGGLGNDKLYGDEGNDLLVGGLGKDTLEGGKGNDILIGGDAFINSLNGSNDIFAPDTADRDDTLRGGDGNDILIGGKGNDLLVGDNGADVFKFLSASDGTDTIKDFKMSYGDKIDISNVLESFDPLTDAISDFVKITTQGKNSVLSVDADGGGDHFASLAIIEGVKNLNIHDMIENGSLIV